MKRLKMATARCRPPGAAVPPAVSRRAALAVVAGLVLLSATAGCRRPETANRVRVSGASTVYPIVVMAGEALRAGEVLVEAQAGGSTRGFEDTVAGRNDLGAMARDPTAEEAAQIITFPIALDGVGIVVHASNPLPAISTGELRRIYTKELASWRQLGGTETPIVAVGKAAGHATLETFLDHTGLDRDHLAVDVVAGDNAQVIRVVANTPGAIGYVSLGEVVHGIEAGMALRLVPLDGVAPTLQAVADGRYPMSRTLFLVSRGEPTGASRKLIDFLRSDPGRAVIERGRYVPFAG